MNVNITNWIRSINSLNKEIVTLKSHNQKLTYAIAELSDRNLELENLLYVLTRNPDELDEIRKRLKIKVDKNSYAQGNPNRRY